MKPVKKAIRDSNIETLLRHFGFLREEPIMRCRMYADKRFRLYKVFNRVVDVKTKRSYSPQEIVMELLGCDAQEATRYMTKHDLV